MKNRCGNETFYLEALLKLLSIFSCTNSGLIVVYTGLIVVYSGLIAV